MMLNLRDPTFISPSERHGDDALENTTTTTTHLDLTFVVESHNATSQLSDRGGGGFAESSELGTSGRGGGDGDDGDEEEAWTAADLLYHHPSHHHHHHPSGSRSQSHRDRPAGEHFFFFATLAFKFLWIYMAFLLPFFFHRASSTR